MMRDAIDFPCSATFREYYASQGSTPDFPKEYYEGVEDRRRERALEEKNLELQAQLTLAQRGVIMVEPVVSPKVTKYGSSKSMEAIVTDLQRTVKGITQNWHTHSKKSSPRYKDYSV